MRLQGRLKKLELVVAPPASACDCPCPTWHAQLADGSIYPPAVPCLRGRCPLDDRFGQESPHRMIIVGCTVRSEDEPAPGFPVRVEDFRCWDPETNSARLRIIVWRDAESGLLRYHGPPRWYEIEVIEKPRLVRAAGVTESVEEIVAELRRTDETLKLAEINGRAAEDADDSA